MLDNDRYQVIRYIASGGMGHVYEAEDRVTSRRVAVKLAEGGAESRRCLIRESQWMHAVSHPGVVRPLDSGLTGKGRPYLAMELIGGRTLHEIVSRAGAVRLPDAVDVMTQLCGAVSAVHRAGIVHRDLKPANVLVELRADGHTHVTLIDFGLATCVSDVRRRALSVVGTPGYIAPEVTRGTPADERSDVYGLGAILHFLLLGRSARRDASETAPADLRTPRTDTARVLPAAVELIDRCLDQNPRRRPPSAAYLARTLARLQSRSEPVRFPAPSPRPRPSGTFECVVSAPDTVRQAVTLTHAC